MKIMQMPDKRTLLIGEINYSDFKNIGDHFIWMY